MFKLERFQILFPILLFFIVSACDSENEHVVLNQPDQLQVHSYAVDQVKLTWSDRSAGEDGYIVEKSEDNISFSELARLAENSESFIDTNIQNGEYAYYRVMAYHESKYSEQSELSSVFHTVVNACAASEIDLSLNYGQILDLPVFGLNYQSAETAAVTDENAGFYVPESTEVEFRIGYISLGHLPKAKNISINNLFESTISVNKKLNIIRLLIALDEDNNIENGIQLSCDLSMASGDIEFDVNEKLFSQQEDLISLLAGRSMLSQQEANNIFQAKLKKYYAGDYSVEYQHYIDSFYPVKGIFTFTLTEQGEMINQHYNGFTNYTIKETVFDLDADNNLVIKISVSGQILFQTVRKVRMVANINADKSITGWSKLYFIFGEDIGYVSGGLQ